MAQLWADLQYRLRACAANWKVLDKGLGSLKYELVSLLGVVWTIKKEWRYLLAAVYVIDLNDFTI